MKIFKGKGRNYPATGYTKIK